jgi:hypothetical protein
MKNKLIQPISLIDEVVVPTKKSDRKALDSAISAFIVSYDKNSKTTRKKAK